MGTDNTETHGAHSHLTREARRDRAFSLRLSDLCASVLSLAGLRSDIMKVRETKETARMSVPNRRRAWCRAVLAMIVGAAMVVVPLGAQDRLKLMPGYEQFQKMSRETPVSYTHLTLPTIYSV